MKNVEDIYQLSLGQEAVLASGQLGQLSCALSGALDITSLEWAWQQVLNRHSILRTSFVWERLDKPLQVVNRELSIALQIHDLESVTEGDLDKLRCEELTKEIDPAVAPLARVVLCRASDDLSYLILTYHALILDERSVSLLLREVLTAYASAGNGRHPQLASVGPFWSYVSWVKEQDLAGAKSFWRESLRDLKGQTPLPEIYARGELVRSEIGYDQIVTEISSDTFEALAALADRLQINLETLMHGAWALLLHRESSGEDLVYGYAQTPANLNGNVLGPLSVTMPVRVRIDPHTPADSWIRSLENQLNEIRRHAFWYPNELPQFQSVVTDHRDDFIEVHGSSLKALNVRTRESVDAPLVVNLPKPTVPRLRLRYDPTLFASETIQRIGAHFETLIAGLIANPEQPILDLPFLTAAEVEQLSIWNQTATDYPRERCIHQLFEEQAEVRGAEIAVVFEDKQLSYAELNERANQLGHHLRSLGVQPETRIALCVERSLEMLIGMLGILKAGAAFAPLDPSHPLERLSFMLEDLQAPIVLTQQHLLDKLPAHWGQVISLDSDWEPISLESTHNPINEATAENLAYVMYTSGSTGMPKGVSVAHRAVVRLIKNTDYVRLGPDEVFLQFAPISFDASTLEIWGCLLNGGRLAVMPPALPSLDILGETLRKHGVTTMWLTAGLFHLMVDERLNDLQSVRQLLAGGDALSVSHVKKAFQSLPSCQLINGYGPTEGTTFTCCYPVRDLTQLRTSVPIGRPIANTQAFILDRHLRPVPAGVIGELYIGGDGLARDYHNRPDLTAERFVPSTQGDVPGARLYKTGDLVRYLPDGNIEFLGRRDLQVKIRGFRIELGEVEAVLNEHPALQDAVVIARADIGGEKQLVAYLVSREGNSVSIDELRDFLRRKLPEHMVPASFVWLEAFPLTPNGKVDRRALPAPDGDRRGLAEDFVAPRTEVEQLLAVIWSQALGVDQVGIDDNFFSLGGDSIRSVQVLAKAQERGLAFSLQDLFQYQTIRELAAVARNSSGLDLPEPTLPFQLITEEDRQKLPADVEDAYPLTVLQAGMIYHSELEPESAVYHDLFSHHVRAPYIPDAIRNALEFLTQQHAALRTCFVLQGFSEPLQIVRRTAEIPVHIADLRDLSHSEQEKFLRERFERASTRTFDWGKAPLLSVELHRRATDSFQFTLSFHHAILDGWSLASMLAELFQTYFSIIEQNESPASSQLIGSYRDYVAMERIALRSDECRQYWNEKLAGGNGSLKYWPPRQLEEESSGNVHKVSLAVPVELVTRLKLLAGSVSVPIKSVLLAAHLKVISVLSGQSDVITGLVTNGRPEEGDGERLLGLFLNTIPIRQQIRPGSWNELVQETFQNEWEALPYRWYPLGQMQRDQGGAELFETAFNFTHFHVARALQDRSRVELLGSISFERTNFPLFANFGLGLNSTEILLSIDADAKRFSKEQTEAIAGYYLRALEAMTAESESNHAWTSLLPYEQQEQVLVAWNDTLRDYAIDQCIHELFEAQAARTPHAVAVVFENERLTYSELNSRANQVSAWLLERGVLPETRIGLGVDRSLEMIVTVFGILKAGAVYVPLDRGYPKERLAFMLQDAQVELVLAQQQWSESLPHDVSQVVWIDREWDEIGKYNADKRFVRSSPQNLAYIIYTSGSTGQPKGVMISHSALVNYAHGVIAEFQLTPMDRILQFASLTFDTAAEEIFPTLMSGATLVLRTEAMMSSVSTFLQTCADFGITVLDLPTAFWHFMIGEMISDDLEIPETVRLTVIGGEKALPGRLSQWQARISNRVCLKNSYGPTEATIGSTMVDLNGHIADNRVNELSIGRPVANARIYILDPNLHPVPPGTAGEICIGGSGLARGYWNQPALTAERFIPDNWSGERGQRLYRTGDRARYRPDGEIEFVERMDQQVKVRGFRIELGEIETRLLEYPNVREVVVTTQQQGTDDVRLIAYIVANEDPAVRPESLRLYLQEKLPEYMVPAAFVLLAALPLSPSGKVDRRALPAADEEALALAVTEPVTPHNEIEQLLHSIWSEVLKTDRFGIHDNFFALGGHSLLATQVITRIRKVFNLQAPLRQLFAHATIAELAHWVDEALRSGSDQAPPLQKASRTRPLPLSFAQQRLWFIDQLQPGTTIYNMPLALRLHGTLDLTVLERVLTEIVRRHEGLRTSFESRDGEPVQVIAAPEQQKLDVKDVSELSVEERAQIAIELVNAETQTPFDLARGPLLRVRVLRLAPQEHLVVLVMHHVISDGWSMDVLLREVSTLYAAFSRGEGSPLPELEIQYADYAVWQREWLQDEELERQMSYWQRQLHGAPTVLELPQDHPRPPVQTHNGATHTFALGPELSSRVRELGRKTGMTTFMVLLASWQVLLKRLSGSDDICVGTVLAGRTHPQVEPLIGFFVNTLVLRADMSGDPTFAELLQRVREVCLEAYSHQDVPFEKLVEELAPERSMAHAPLFQVMMVMQQQQQQAEETAPVDGLTISGMDAAGTSAKFDLTIYLRESREVIVGALEYNTDIFASERVAAMVQQWERILAMAVAQPERRISELPLLSEAEQEQQLGAWNAGDTFTSELTVVELFEAQVARRPAAVALVCNGEELTYEELNRRANRLGQQLQQLGVGPEQLVGVCVERSLEMVVALLGVMKAGGAYVPLDPAYPQERLAFMVADAGVRVIVAQAEVVERLPAPDAALVYVAAAGEEDRQAASENVRNETSADNTAYVIYTSGSTGQPKGVAITHRNVVRLFAGTERYYEFGAEDVWTLFHSYAFDFSVWEMWGALLYGGKLVVVPYWVSRSPEAFYELLAAEGVTVLNQTPSAFRQLSEVDSGEGASLRLRLVIFGGEALELNALGAWYERHGEAGPQLVNMYGITETTVHVTYRALRTGEIGSQSVIGGALPDLQVYVLDEHLRLLPVGVSGELYVGGAGLGRGYLNRPELTAERFLPDPYSSDGGRLYKTGDLARYLPDGDLVYLGRADDQVKIRGFRIELGEIETVLNQHPLVTAAAVVRQDGIEPRLAAYVVSVDTGLTTAELRLFTKDRLPDYMVPSVFIFLDHLPLTENGKVDRRALQQCEQDASFPTDAFVAPRDVVELQLAQIWEDILGVKSIGVRDNFFDLGGHSFLAVRLMARIKEQTGQSLPLALLMQEGTIEALAGRLRDQPTLHSTSPLVALRSEGSAPGFFCVHPAGGNVLCYASLARHLGPAQRFYAFQARGLEDGGEPLTSIEAAASDYVDAMREAQPEGPYFIGGWSVGGLIAFEMSRILQTQGQQTALLALFDSYLVGDTEVDEDEATLLIGSALHMGLPPEQILSLRQSLIALEPEARLEFTMSYIRDLDLLPRGLEEAQARKLIKVFKANLDAARNYSPQPADVRVTFFKANDGTEEPTGDPVTAWIPLARKGVEVHEVRANHFTMMYEPHVKVLAELLNESISDWQLLIGNCQSEM
jgi:amino acid adenylation domain-containing protein